MPSKRCYLLPETPGFTIVFGLRLPRSEVRAFWSHGVIWLTVLVIVLHVIARDGQGL